MVNAGLGVATRSSFSRLLRFRGLDLLVKETHDVYVDLETFLPIEMGTHGAGHRPDRNYCNT